MKRLIRGLFVILVSVVLLPNIVFADENKVTLTAPKTISKDEELKVNINLTSVENINNLKTSLTYESAALEVMNIEMKNGWKQENPFSKASPISLDFIHENGQAGETTIATVTFKVKSEGTKTETVLSIEGTIKNLEDETLNPFEKNTITVEIKSKDNTLKDLKFNGSAMPDRFQKDKFIYAFDVDSSVTTANFEAVLNDSTATFKEGYEPETGVPLDYGSNAFEIIVVSAFGEERSYLITVTRPDNRGTNNDLSSLVINANPKLLDFKAKDIVYTVTTHKLETIEVTAVAADPKATVDIEKPEALKIGSNEVKITVTSENKSEKVYTVIINNLDRDIDTTLSDIELFGCDEDFTFQKDKYDYEVRYSSKCNKDSLVIKPVLNNEEEAEIDNAKLESDVSKLKAGKSVTITVKAKDGTKGVESTYTITFKQDTRINFFLILGIIIFIVLLIIFIKLLLRRRKNKKILIEKEKELEQTKRLEKVNLE